MFLSQIPAGGPGRGYTNIDCLRPRLLRQMLRKSRNKNTYHRPARKTLPSRRASCVRLHAGMVSQSRLGGGERDSTI